MGTKNNPGSFDCYGKAEGDEPQFVLLGRDPTAALVVAFWVKMRIEMGQPIDDVQLEEARECARQLERWAREHGKDEKVQQALAAFERLRASKLIPVGSFTALPEDLAAEDSEHKL